MMLAFLVCKSKEDNFAACMPYNGPGRSSHTRQMIRLLSFYYRMDGYPHEYDIGFHTRSLAFHGHHPELVHVVSFNKKKFKYLRVLDFNGCGDLENRHLVDICGLSRLRYLGLNGCHQITELPREIGRLWSLKTLAVKSSSISKLPMEIENLQNLESLNISDTKITELPREVGKLQHLGTLKISNTMFMEVPREICKLQHLKTLDISNTDVRELPWEIGELQHLETLNIRNTRITELPREIWKLQHLRIMDIRMTEVRELYCEVPNSLTVIAGSMDTALEQKVRLDVASPAWKNRIISSGAKCREHISVLIINNFYRFEIVPMHRLAGRHLNVPEWVKKDLSNVSSLDITLYKLGEDDLEFLKKMPNLQALELRLEVLPREPIAITDGGFSKLKTFNFDCCLPRVTFQPEAMPVLKHLEFKFYTGTASLGCSMGIMNLPSLENVVFRCSKYYTSDRQGISTVIEAVRKEATAHPNEITLWVNHMKPEVFHQAVGSTKSPFEKEAEERDRVREQRERLRHAAENRRAQRDKNNARGGIRS